MKKRENLKITLLYRSHSHIAGLSASRAENIVKHRNENGTFKSREDLKKVKSIGDKTFLQCAGFVRIEPLTAKVSSLAYNKLDSTWVHPESYAIAKKIIKSLSCSIDDVGAAAFVANVRKFVEKNKANISSIAREYKVPEERVNHE